MMQFNTFRQGKSPQAQLKTFMRDEAGSFSIEAVIWTPILCVILAVVMNISMVFFEKSQMLRVVQDANRLYSLGKLHNAVEVQDYVLAELAYTDADITVQTTIDNLKGIVTTDARAPATDLMPMNFMTKKFLNIDVFVWAQHIIEF